MIGHTDGSVLNDDSERPGVRKSVAYNGGPGPQLLAPAVGTGPDER